MGHWKVNLCGNYPTFQVSRRGPELPIMGNSDGFIVATITPSYDRKAPGRTRHTKGTSRNQSQEESTTLSSSITSPFKQAFYHPHHLVKSERLGST